MSPELRRARRADLLTRMLERIRELQPTFSDDLACELERQLRSEFGGAEEYIGKKPRAVPVRARALLAAGDRSGAAAAAGLSLPTLYRRIARR